MGPPIALRLPARDDQQLAAFIHDGMPARGMPPSESPIRELNDLVNSCARFERRPEAKPIVADEGADHRRRDARRSGAGEGFDDLQLLTDDKRVHLLRRAGERLREVTSETDWPTYNGDPRGNRYTTLTQIDKTNVSAAGAEVGVHVARRAASCRGRRSSSAASCTSPAPNECFALDAGTGRQIWHFKRPRTKGVDRRAAPIAASAVAGDRRLHGDRQRAHHRAESLHGRAAVGHRARRLAQELRGLLGAAPRRQSGDLRRDGRRARRERLRRRARSGDRQGSLAVLDRAQAGRARIGDVAGQGHRARRRADLVHRQLRSGARHRLLADRQSGARSTTATIARATTSTPTASWRSIARPAS